MASNNALPHSPSKYRVILSTWPRHKCFAPAFVVLVQGGKAIIMSHRPTIVCTALSQVLNVQLPFSRGRTSCMMCHSGCPPEHGIMSQEYDSCPNRRNSIVTACDSSQATSIFISPPHQIGLSAPCELS